ncbi:hypothetical protein PG995_004295 [Apiospora arundinis]
MRFNSRCPLKPRELYTREQQAQRYGSSEKAMVYDARLDQLPHIDPYGYGCTLPGPIPSPMPLPELWHMSGASYELSSSVGGVASSSEETTMDATSANPPRVTPLSVSPVVQVADECEVDDDNEDSDWDLAGGSEVSEEETDTDDNNDKTPNLLDLLDGDDDSEHEDWDMV